jgi:hypothetical protein
MVLRYEGRGRVLKNLEKLRTYFMNAPLNASKVVLKLVIINATKMCLKYADGLNFFQLARIYAYRCQIIMLKFQQNPTTTRFRI